VEAGSRKIINRASVVNALIAAVTSPVPLLDELIFAPGFVFMAARIGRKQGVSLVKMPWRPIGGTIVTGLAARAAINVAVSYIPGVAAALNAVTAVTLTQFLGRYVVKACERPEEARKVAIKDLVDEMRSRLPKSMRGKDPNPVTNQPNGTPRNGAPVPTPAH
jgi:uncharacterized protein (DUF697 family)